MIGTVISFGDFLKEDPDLAAPKPPPRFPKPTLAAKVKRNQKRLDHDYDSGKLHREPDPQKAPAKRKRKKKPAAATAPAATKKKPAAMKKPKAPAKAKKPAAQAASVIKVTKTRKKMTKRPANDG